MTRLLITQVGWRPGTETRDLPALAAVLIVLLAATALMDRLVRVLDVRHLSIPGTTYIAYILLVVVPAALLYGDVLGFGDVLPFHLLRDPWRQTYLIAVCAGVVAFVGGVWVVVYLTHFRRKETTLFFSQPFAESARSVGAKEKLLFLAAFGVAVALTVAYLRETPNVPLLSLLTGAGNARDLALQREQSLKLLDSPLRHPYLLLQSEFYPFLAMLAIGYAIRTRERLWALAATITCALGLLFASLSLAKAPVFIVVLLLALFMWLYRGGHLGRYAWPFLVSCAVAALAFPFLVQITASGGDAGEAFEKIYQRILFGPAHILSYYFEVFPDIAGFQDGRSLGRFVELAGLDYVDVSNVVYLFIAKGSGVQSGSANGPFVGALYADYGLAGVAIGSAFLGGLAQVFQVIAVRLQRTIVLTALYALLIYEFLLVTILPWTSAIITSLMPLVAVLLFVRALRASVAGSAEREPSTPHDGNPRSLPPAVDIPEGARFGPSKSL
jgi:oligosaccharide repeat unit polymerase